MRIIDLAGEGDWEGGTPPSPNYQNRTQSSEINKHISTSAVQSLTQTSSPDVPHMRNCFLPKLISGGGTAQRCRGCGIYYVDLLYLAGDIFKHALRNLKVAK